MVPTLSKLGFSGVALMLRLGVCRCFSCSVLVSRMVPIGSKVVPFCVLYFGSYKVIPKRNYFGAYG